MIETKTIKKHTSSAGIAVKSIKVTLPDDQQTTVHVAAYPRQRFAVRVAVFPEAQRLVRWCRRQGVDHAMTGGFFSRADNLPLGETWMRGVRVEAVPFGKQWVRKRSALHADGDFLQIAPLGKMPMQPRGDLLTAGPALVRDGRSLITPAADYEGIPETWHGELDDDWTGLRAQRTAIGFNDDLIWSVACDGQSSQAWQGFEDPDNPDAGMYLEEMAEVMLALGAEHALNLDGGGGATLVHDRALLNVPRAGQHDPEEIGAPMPEGRPIHTALTFLPR